MNPFDQGGLTAREEWQEIVSREDELDRLFGRSPFRDEFDYMPAPPFRASEVSDEEPLA